MPEQLTHAEEADLISRIDAAGLAPFRFQQWTGKRLTRSYGWSYDFQTGIFARTDPIPHWMEPLRERVAGFAQLAPDDLEQAIVLRYDAGAGIGWHRDRSVFGHVLGVSLGADAAMQFRQRTPRGFARVSALLPARSFYHLSGEARHWWEHSIRPMDRARWSITFRTLSARVPG